MPAQLRGIQYKRRSREWDISGEQGYFDSFFHTLVEELLKAAPPEQPRVAVRNPFKFLAAYEINEASADTARALGVADVRCRSILEPRGRVSACSLARTHAAEVEAQHRTPGPRSGPGQLGADDVVHRPGLGRRREHEDRRHLRAPVPEPLQDEVTNRDERRTLQVLAAAHHGVTRSTRNLR